MIYHDACFKACALNMFVFDKSMAPCTSVKMPVEYCSDAFYRLWECKSKMGGLLLTHGLLFSACTKINWGEWSNLRENRNALTTESIFSKDLHWSCLKIGSNNLLISYFYARFRYPRLPGVRCWWHRLLGKVEIIVAHAKVVCQDPSSSK